MPDELAGTGLRRRITYTGQVAPGVAASLTRYGASQRLVRAAQQRTADPGHQVISTTPEPRTYVFEAPPQTGIGALLTRLAGADPELLDLLPGERPRFQSLGAVLLNTALVAAFSMGVAVHLVTGSTLLAVPLGLLWGAIILTIDRGLVVSAMESSRTVSRLLVLLPRLLISVLIGAVTATPLMLQVFEPAVRAHIDRSRPDLAGTQVGILDRLQALNQLGQQNSYVHAGTLALMTMLTLIGAMPSLIVFLTRLRPAYTYERVLEVKERYATVAEELSEIRKQAHTTIAVTTSDDETDVREPAQAVDTPPSVEQKIDMLTERLNELIDRLPKEQERDVAEVIDISTRRPRAS